MMFNIQVSFYVFSTNITGDGPPCDKIQLKIVKLHLNEALFFTISVVCCLGICLALAFIIFTHFNGHLRFVSLLLV